jgi:hypothetical protein
MTTRPCGESDRDPSAGTSPPRSADELELERIWLSAQALEWRSLALVPASDDVGVVQLASAFSALGFRDRGESIGVADLRDVPFPNLRGPIEVIRWHIRRGERVILALSPCSSSAATVPLVRAADCAILCIALGATRIAEANQTVEQVGGDAFLGTVLVRPDVASLGHLPTTAYRLRGTR